MLQGPVLQGTIIFEYTFLGSLHCSFKINDTKENSTKHIKNNKPHFKLSAHTHTDTSHDNKFAAVLLVLQSLQSTLFSGASGQVCESVSHARKAHENWFPLVRTNLRWWCHPISAVTEKMPNPRVKNQTTRREKQPIVAFGSNKSTPKHYS